MKIRFVSLAGIAGVALLTTAVADAHISIASGPAVADASQEITFGVGHGCSDTDTYRVTVDIPAGVTSVRPLRSDFGPFTVTKDGTGNVTSVTWQKPDAELHTGDPAYYKLVIRLKTPKAPFTKIYFPTHQICKAPGGTELPVVEWTGTPTLPDGGSTSPEAAPSLVVMPARTAGWNKYPIPVAIKDLSVFFKDAAVVWKGSAAYSSNANTTAQLKAESGVTELKELAAGDEVWVRY